jgi:integrase
MASLYKPSIVTYRLPDGNYRTPDGKRVTRDTPGAIKEVTKSKKWYGRYTDGAGRPQRVPLSESKDTARRMLAKLAGDAQLAGVGIEDRYAEHRARPLAEHVEDFRRYLAAKGRCKEHVANTAAKVNAVLHGCHFKHTDTLEAAPVVEFLAALRGQTGPPLPPLDLFTSGDLAALLGVRVDSVNRMVRRGLLRPEGRGRGRKFKREEVKAMLARRRGIGVETSNHYLAAVKAFSKWLSREHRIPYDPLAHLSRQNADVDRRRVRRALRQDAFERFIDATAAGKPFRGLTGADRLALYTLAANTGFRANELASLTPASFALDADPPTVTVEAGYSKHRRKDVQPIRADVAELMREYMADRQAGSVLWPGAWADVAAEMIRLDLAAAGIPYQDDAGRYFDFHAVRGQFISMLAASGVHPKVAQILARHSTITLTMDYYTHLDVLDVTAALDKLPGVNGQGAGKARPLEKRA